MIQLDKITYNNKEYELISNEEYITLNLLDQDDDFKITMNFSTNKEDNQLAFDAVETFFTREIV